MLAAEFVAGGAVSLGLAPDVVALSDGPPADGAGVQSVAVCLCGALAGRFFFAAGTEEAEPAVAGGLGAGFEPDVCGWLGLSGVCD